MIAESISTMLPRKTSIVAIVIFALVTVSTVLLGTFGLINYCMERERQRTKLQSDLAVSADQISAGLALPVWNFDIPQVDKILESVMQNQAIYGVVVSFVDAKSTIHARVRDDQWNIRPTDHEFSAVGLLVEERTLTVESGTIGNLKLFATTRFVEAELKRTLVSIVANILVLDVILTFSLYLLLCRWVFWPLKKVEGYAAAVSSGGKNVNIPDKPFHGELERLRTSIEKMIEQLEARYDEQQKAEKVLRRQLAFEELMTGLLERYSSSSGAELDSYIVSSLEEIARFLGADYAFIIQVPPDLKTWSATHEWCAPGIKCRIDKFQNIPMGTRPWTEKVLLADEPVVISSLSEFPRDHGIYKCWAEESFKSMIQVPLHGRGGDVNGSIGLTACSREIDWSPDDLRRLSMLSDAIANTLERKRAEEALRQSREQLRALSSRLQSLREEERTRISREIHDHLGQLLTALKLDMRALERKVSGMLETELTAALYSKINSAQKLTDETIASVQKIATELRPGVLDRLGLAAAIEAETQTFQSRTGLECKWNIPDELPEIPAEQATAMFRIFQEILTNVARHAHATRLDVSLNCRDGKLLLQVKDDGVGIRKSDIENSKSLGIIGIQERAGILGGDVKFDRASDKGTTVTVQMPFDKKATQSL